VEKAELRVRFLATSGIATGVGEDTTKLNDFQGRYLTKNMEESTSRISDIPSEH
jgi:hypothetical protein